MLFWMLLLVHLVLQQPNGCFACVEQERVALLDIKSAFTNDHESIADQYYNFKSWNKSIDCCSWYGVWCSSTTKHVNRLSLHSYGYTLNISLFLPFRELRSLTLSDNRFNSCIPNDCFSRLRKLNSLEYLDLSWSYFDSKALSSLAALSSLKALSLHSFWLETEFFNNGSVNVHKQSQPPSELFINVLFGALSKLSKLKYLDLSDNYLNGSIIPYLGQISSLKTLDLHWNNIGEGLDLNACQAWSNMSRLENLYLRSNSLNERIMPCLIKAPSLKILDLSGNNMGGNFSLNACQAWSNMSRLENLNLVDNSLNERIIPCLIRAPSLKILDLSWNNMGGNFSLKEISKLNNLVELDLSGNKFTGVSPLMVEWTSLKRLYIIGNELNGTSLEGICKIKNLEELDIGSNNIKGNIPMCFGHLSSLRYIDISYNQFGTHFLPSVIRNLTMLKYAYFSDNNFEGTLFIDLFFNSTNLKAVDLSNNYKLEIQTQQLGMVPSFQLNEIILSNCIINKPSSFSTLLSNQYMIEYIDLSSVNLKGTIPLWLFENKTKLNSLDLRNNLLNGQLIFPSQKTNLTFFDISNNKLIGKIPNNIDYVLPNIKYLAMSHNSLKGAIPSSFGNLNQLIFLDLSFNNLIGSFPSCIKNLSNLRAINLRENKLEGNLTYEFCHSSNTEYMDLSKNNFFELVSSCINNSNLKYLNINGNHLTGPFPSAILGNSLAVLDIGNNNFNGNISSKIWTSLKNLKIISLRGNYFEGALSREICELKDLRVLDLSQNKLHGNIPSCIHYMGSEESFPLNGGFSIGFDHSEERFIHDVMFLFEYVKFSTKGRSDTYQGYIINSLSGLDLSGNQFDGKIPKRIGEMTWLRALNLSSNRLTGPIPATLSRLRDIESLDLSHNKLIGHLPSQLAELHFLQVFSVAYNNLSGPTLGLVAQFSTFDESSYEGNPYLCGPPLVKQCTAMVPSPKLIQVTNDDDDEDAMSHILFFASFALGFITGFWGWMVLLYFKRSWQYSFFVAVDKYMKEALDMANYLLMKMRSLW